MKPEKSRFTLEAAPQSNAGQRVITSNDLAATVPINSVLTGGRQTSLVSARALHKATGAEAGMLTPSGRETRAEPHALFIADIAENGLPEKPLAH